MSNISIVDYLKMAAGYNRNDSGTMHRRSISPWAQSLNSSNQNSSPNNFNNQAIPQPPPPPMFRDDRTAMPQRHFPYRENSSRNPFERSSDSYFNNRNFKNNGGRSYNHNKQPYSSPRAGSDSERFSNRHNNDRNNWRFQNRGFNRYKRNSDSEQRSKPSFAQDMDKDNSDIECISIVENSPSDILSDRSVASPDITEVPIRQNSFNSTSTSSVREHPNGVSQLERAYNRRVSANSDTSDIGIIQNSNTDISNSKPIDDSTHYLPVEANNTPASPVR